MASDAPESSLGYRQRTASRRGSLTGPGAPLRTADLRLCWNDARYRSTRRIETRAGFYGSYLPSAAIAIATRICDPSGEGSEGATALRLISTPIADWNGRAPC